MTHLPTAGVAFACCLAGFAAGVVVTGAQRPSSVEGAATSAEPPVRHEVVGLQGNRVEVQDAAPAMPLASAAVRVKPGSAKPAVSGDARALLALLKDSAGETNVVKAALLHLSWLGTPEANAALIEQFRSGNHVAGLYDVWAEIFDNMDDPGIGVMLRNWLQEKVSSGERVIVTPLWTSCLKKLGSEEAGRVGSPGTELEFAL